MRDRVLLVRRYLCECLAIGRVDEDRIVAEAVRAASFGRDRSVDFATRDDRISTGDDQRADAYKTSAPRATTGNRPQNVRVAILPRGIRRRRSRRDHAGSPTERFKLDA